MLSHSYVCRLGGVMLIAVLVSLFVRNPVMSEEPKAATLETATLGSGCFWCTEAVFDRLKGVQSAVSGYSGGQVPNPTYEQVCTGKTGHAEVVQVTFDPQQISFAEVLEVFWKTHDPTTKNRQGADVGPQYRSVIFYHNEAQRDVAASLKKELNKTKAFGNPVVTEIEAFNKFYPAEDYHQQYFELNGRQPYCQAVIAPKVEKFEKAFKDKVRKE